MSVHREIERKFLIRYPDTALLEAQPGREIWEIVQTYLTDGEDGCTRRVRQVICEGQTTWFRAFKHRLSSLSTMEDECEISAEAYKALFAQRDPWRESIRKTRYRIPYRGHVVEIDLYPFWRDRAIMEIELEDEAEQADIPDYIDIVWDVTGDGAYKNSQLARHIPMEDLPTP